MNEKSTNLYDCTAQRGMSDPGWITHVIVLYCIDIPPTLITVIGNIICIFALVKTPSLQRPSNIWVGALCVSDLIVGLLAQPIYYGSLVSMITGKAAEVLWMASTNVAILLGTLSFFMAYFVTLDRYLAICYPFWYARVVTKNLCIFGAVLGFVLSIPSIIVYNTVPSAIIPYCTVQMILIFSQITAFYCRIYANILRQRRHISSLAVVNQDRSRFRRRNFERKRAYTIAIIIVTMLISYVPMNVLIVIFSSKTPGGICKLTEQGIIAISWGQFFVLLNSAMNPIIYCFRMQDIRKAIKRLYTPAENFSVDAYPSGTETY